MYGYLAKLLSVALSLLGKESMGVAAICLASTGALQKVQASDGALPCMQNMSLIPITHLGAFKAMAYKLYAIRSACSDATR